MTDAWKHNHAAAGWIALRPAFATTASFFLEGSSGHKKYMFTWQSYGVHGKIMESMRVHVCVCSSMSMDVDQKYG